MQTESVPPSNLSNASTQNGASKKYRQPCQITVHHETLLLLCCTGTDDPEGEGYLPAPKRRRLGYLPALAGPKAPRCVFILCAAGTTCARRLCPYYQKSANKSSLTERLLWSIAAYQELGSEYSQCNYSDYFPPDDPRHSPHRRFATAEDWHASGRARQCAYTMQQSAPSSMQAL